MKEGGQTQTNTDALNSAVSWYGILLVHFLAVIMKWGSKSSRFVQGSQPDNKHHIRKLKCQLIIHLWPATKICV